jgi:hypothetical protein
MARPVVQRVELEAQLRLRPPCEMSSLRVRANKPDLVDGDEVRQVVALRNVSGDYCEVGGYPIVQFLRRKRLDRFKEFRGRDSATGYASVRPVSLRPGSVASFAMDLGSPLSNLGVYCRSVDSVSVRLPGYRLADRVRDRISVCGSGGTVSAFVKGSDGPQRQLGERDPPPVALVQADCEHPTANLVYRPRMIVAGCGGAVFSLTRIRYGRWGGRVVAGHAIQRFNDCKPDCATGSQVDRPVTFRLYRLRVTNYQPRYTALSVHGNGEPGRYPL